MRIFAVDTGGTFTDMAAYDSSQNRIVCSKSLTTYDDLTDGILTTFDKSGVVLAGEGIFKHGTTIVINALLQRSASGIALVTTRGFRDVLEMARGNRPVPFDLFYERSAPLVPRELRYEIDERMDGQGKVLRPPRRDEVDALAGELKALGIAAVAVSFLNSYINPEHEQLVGEWLRAALPDVFVTCGTDLTREWYEYERTATAAANAYVGPQMNGYVRLLGAKLTDRDFTGKFYLMGSNGGVVSADRALREPIMLVESGPVGGCIGAAAYARDLGIDNVLAFDMGGTTAKCALIEKGQFDVKPVYYVGGYDYGFPVRGAVIDIVEVSAGGGSIAWLDETRRLHLGPRSAGSTPGPACYGRGGTEPTITDANAVLGRISPDAFLGGEMHLDIAAAQRAINDKIVKPYGLVGESELLRMAAGMISIATVIMAGSIKRVSVERGRDPRDDALFAYGGGGPLHAVDLARELHIPTVIVPPEPGNFSAIGMLLADVRRDRAETVILPLVDASLQRIGSEFQRLEALLREELQSETGSSEIATERQAEMRYRGQVHSLLTPCQNFGDVAELRRVFEDLYLRRYGHVEQKNPVEIVSLHVIGRTSVGKPDLASLRAESPAGEPSRRVCMVYFAGSAAKLATAVYRRHELPDGFTADGPALIQEYGSTTLVGVGDHFTVGRLGEIRITVGGA